MERNTRIVTAAFLAGLAMWAQAARAEGGAETIVELAASARPEGGLCVHVGCGRGEVAAEMVCKGGFLVQGLEADAERVEEARAFLGQQGLYGQATAQAFTPGRLPHADNLVNVVIVEETSRRAAPLAEVMRVLCPGGVAFIGGGSTEGLSQAAASTGFADVRAVGPDGQWLRAVKPASKAMDGWTHARYDASGNAVSADRLAGPPRHIRWIAGPRGGTNQMVTAGGKNFYAGTCARDAFNGLLLWSRSLRTRPVSPVLSDKHLLVVHPGGLAALDPVTGETVRTYEAAGNPVDFVYCDGAIVALDAVSVRAVDAETGKRLWQRKASMPGCLVVGGGAAFYVDGNPRRGEKCSVLAIGLRSGEVRWTHKMRMNRPDPAEYEWLIDATTCTYHDGLLAFEASPYSDFGDESAIHVLSAADGKYLWSRTYSPHGAHAKQARALFGAEKLWIVLNKKIEGLDPQTGSTTCELAGGSGHCYPPLATERFVFSGEMSVTELAGGRLTENRIAKGSCSRMVGVIPANGLVYTFPKGCSCWPMLKGYTALAPAAGGEPVADKPDRPADFLLAKGTAAVPSAPARAENEADWPAYRRDALRSNATAERLPKELNVLWREKIAPPLPSRLRDWKDNPFAPGVVTPPVVAAGTVVAAVPERHQVVALDAPSGREKWRFTADGRVDTPPTLADGLCIFGTRCGWVYCLRLDDGEVVWRLRAAPGQEQIVAYGQVESPWPVAGSVLVIDGVAYFAAGRQYLADGGIRVFATDLPTGRVRWVRRVPDLAGFAYYGAAAMEFDSYDLLYREGENISMSRWRFAPTNGNVSDVRKSGFYRTGPAGVMAPRGHWGYGPRQAYGKDRLSRRPQVTFRDNVLVGCTLDRLGLFRRDFALDGGEAFDEEWYSNRIRKKQEAQGGDMSRTQRLMRRTTWSDPAAAEAPIAALVLAADQILTADEKGVLSVRSLVAGKLLRSAKLPAGPVWDGVSVAAGLVYVATSDGCIVCLGATR